MGRVAAVRKRFRCLGEWHEVEMGVTGSRLIVCIDGLETTGADGIADAPGYVGSQAESGLAGSRGLTISERP